MNWVGLDVHQSYCEALVRDDAGGDLSAARIKSVRKDLKAFFQRLGPDTAVAMEATGCWGWIYDEIKPLVRRIVLAHPLKVHLIAKERIKTDRRDAEILCELLRGGWLPEAYAAAPEVRDVRQLVRGRVVLVREAGSMKSRLRAILRMHGVPREKKSVLFGKERKSFWKSVSLPEGTRMVVDRYLEAHDLLRRQVGELEAEIVARAERTPACRLLETIPGVGFFTALLLEAEIADAGRFPTSEAISSWGGLVPSLYSSGGVIRHGGLTKQGNPWVRWALTEASTAAVRASKRFRNLYERVRRRAGRQTARQAVAREMLVVARAMLRSGEVFDPDRAVRPPRRSSAANVASARRGPAPSAAGAPQAGPCSTCGGRGRKVSR